MFTATSTIVIQGNLSDPNIHNAVKIGYSVSNGLSFALLFVSFTICMEIINTCSKFMITKATRFSTALGEARHNTRNNFDDIITHKFVNPSTNLPISESEIDKWWHQIETETTRRLLLRRDLVTKFVNNISFDNFWDSNCADKYHRAVNLFYFGTGLMLLSVVIFCGVKFYLYYSVLGATVAICALLFVALLVSVIFLRIVRSKIEIARVCIQRMQPGDRVEVKRDDSCCCCPYWEPATLRSAYTETGPIEVQYDSTGEILGVDYRQLRECRFTEVKNVQV